MINTQTKGGVHIQKRNEELPDEMVQLMKSQDKEYIKYQRDLSKRVRSYCYYMVNKTLLTVIK
jgi:U3 small nucleolar RNA-associated protein 11